MTIHIQQEYEGSPWTVTLEDEELGHSDELFVGTHTAARAEALREGLAREMAVFEVDKFGTARAVHPPWPCYS